MDRRTSTEQATGNEGARMATGMAIGMALGIAIGLVLDSIAIGAGIGAALGVSLGLAMSEQKQEPSKPIMIAGVVLLLVGIVVLGVFMHLVQPQWWCQYPVLNLMPGC